MDGHKLNERFFHELEGPVDEPCLRPGEGVELLVSGKHHVSPITDPEVFAEKSWLDEILRKL